MLQAHSWLWNYLWVAPQLLLLVLGLWLCCRGLWRRWPAFVAFAIAGSIGEIVVFRADVIPSVTALTFWRIYWTVLLLGSLLKFFVISEMFSRIFNPYPAVSRLGRILISGSGATLVLVSAAVAAFAGGDSPLRLISGFHLLEQTIFLIEAGLIAALFGFAAYFRLSWDRFSFGVMLGLGLFACEQLAAWALVANANPSSHGRTLLEFLNMATYHVAVLIWIYYLLFPGKVVAKSAVSLPEHNLDVWNRELERLLQQ
jgi:hypothetical protein